IIWALSLVITVIAVICVIIPAITGTLQFLIVLSGSMNPLMQPGDMVVVRTMPPEDVRVGDVITFHDPAGTENVIVTHRAIGIEEEDGIINIHTKGDANEDADPFTVTSNDVIGEMVFVLPYLGYAVDRAKGKLTFILLVILPSLLIVADELRKIMIYSNPVLARRINREEKKKERKRRMPVVINYKRLTAILFTGLLVFGMLFIPYLTDCGYAEVSRTERIENFKSLPSVFVFNPVDRTDATMLPNYAVLSGKSAGEMNMISVEPRTKVAVSESPYILPVFWIVSLAGMNPYLPCMVSILGPSILLALILFPLWIQKRFKHRRSILKQLRRMPMMFVGLQYGARA
ncbi:MAG: signal peptidase I, partial [Nitrospiraceae bacterium]|nr:signal peptidase I [Nitrospiraceae bacterium]